MSLKKKKNKLKIWHEKLGHLNMKDIIYMGRRKIATGTPMDNNNKEIFTCEDMLDMSTK